MDEFLWELREHSAGLNCGRWDYIFSFIKKQSEDPAAVLPDRSQVTLQPDEIDALAEYVATKIKGLGKVTLQQCYDYYGPGTVTCDIYAPKSQ